MTGRTTVKAAAGQRRGGRGSRVYTRYETAIERRRACVRRVTAHPSHSRANTQHTFTLITCLAAGLLWESN